MTQLQIIQSWSDPISRDTFAVPPIRLHESTDRGRDGIEDVINTDDVKEDEQERDGGGGQHAEQDLSPVTIQPTVLPVRIQSSCNSVDDFISLRTRRVYDEEDSVSDARIRP